MNEPRHSNSLYAAYAKLPHPVRRLIASMIPASSRGKIRYWARGEANLIAAEIERFDGTAWTDFRSNLSTEGTSERVVEYPWVLSRYSGERRVLDVGTANAIPIYLYALRELKIPELRGVDLSAATFEGITMTQADIRQMPFENGSFDLVFCISTLEHIGRDNTTYGIDSRPDEQGDVQALRELGRVTREAGRILVTVPFGQPRQYEWFKQYDLALWHEVITRAKLTAIEFAVYGYRNQGWSPAPDAHALESAEYRANGTQGAAAVLCSVLRR